eukprot:2410590-Prymnesium_polylepis.1
MARVIFLGLYAVVMRRSATRETASRIDGMTTTRKTNIAFRLLRYIDQLAPNNFVFEGPFGPRGAASRY